jgi:hypothetical protein
MHLAQAKPTFSEDSRPPFCATRKLDEVQKALLWQLLNEEPRCPSRALLQKAAQQQVLITVSIRHLNRIRVRWGCNRGKGRPCHAEGDRPMAVAAEVVGVRPRLSFVGVHLFAHWLEQQHTFAPVVAGLRQASETYKETHGGEDFALLHHKEQTLLSRFQALFFAPLLGIKRLSEFDTREHPLETLVGRTYHSSTLRQFVGQLEWVDAAEALMPTLVPESPGRIGYVDGHMIPYWSRAAMHKGKITMLGRIMAGSQAVITHSEGGEALFVAYHPPDLHLSRVIVDYCQQVAESTGIELFVIDREVNSLAMSRAFESKGWGLLSMLDRNEYHGFESFESTPVAITEDGIWLYEAQWKEARQDDPRCFVLVWSPDGRLLVYWGTSKVKEHLAVSQWPRLYRQRSELQENSFKRMIDHGALNINYGRKTITGPDRHHQRKRDQLTTYLGKAQSQVDKHENLVRAQQDKVAESESKGHGKRLTQRRQTLATYQQELGQASVKVDKLRQQAEALGPPKERADRDFRKQTVMTLRTLLLENALTAFMAVLLGAMTTKASLHRVLNLLFERSGSRVETSSKVIYYVNHGGLSASYRRMLDDMVTGLCAIDLRYDGKPIQVCLRDRSP